MKNSLWIIFPLVLILIGVCGPTAQDTARKKPGGGSSSARTVIDSAGRAVKIPRAIRRVIVTCYGGAAHEVSVLGGADKIVAQPSDRTFRQFHRMYPALDGACDAGSFDNINLEKILSLRPDMVIAGVVSPQGNEKIERLGIPVFTVAVGRADIVTLLREFRAMGTLLGAEEKAVALVSYWRRTLNLIEERVATVPVAKRKSVFYTSHGGVSPLITGGRHSWGHHFIRAGGGINAAASLGFSQELTVEQLLLWNPDVIIVSNTRAGQSPVSAILANQKLKKIKAVKNGAVYPCPVGAFWWDRPSPEAILGILWLSMTLYPEVMEDMDLRREVRCFYRKFHGYELTDAELQSFF
jgi:iron complex transport system substrate-binding protein